MLHKGDPGATRNKVVCAQLFAEALQAWARLLRTCSRLPFGSSAASPCTPHIAPIDVPSPVRLSRTFRCHQREEPCMLVIVWHPAHRLFTKHKLRKAGRIL